MPKPNKNLFVNGSATYIKDLLVKFKNSKNISVKNSANNINNLELRTKLKCAIGTERQYVLIVDKNTNKIITFYPEFPLERKYFSELEKQGFTNYLKFKK